MTLQLVLCMLCMCLYQSYDTPIVYICRYTGVRTHIHPFNPHAQTHNVYIYEVKSSIFTASQDVCRNESIEEMARKPHSLLKLVQVGSMCMVYPIALCVDSR